MKKNEVKCKTCGDKGVILEDHIGLTHPEYEPCPDCTEKPCERVEEYYISGNHAKQLVELKKLLDDAIEGLEWIKENEMRGGRGEDTDRNKL